MRLCTLVSSTVLSRHIQRNWFCWAHAMEYQLNKYKLTITSTSYCLSKEKSKSPSCTRLFSSAKNAWHNTEGLEKFRHLLIGLFNQLLRGFCYMISGQRSFIICCHFLCCNYKSCILTQSTFPALSLHSFFFFLIRCFSRFSLQKYAGIYGPDFSACVKLCRYAAFSMAQTAASLRSVLGAGYLTVLCAFENILWGPIFTFLII